MLTSHRKWTDGVKGNLSFVGNYKQTENWPLMLSFTDSLAYFLFKDTQTTETCWLDFESHLMLVRSVLPRVLLGLTCCHMKWRMLSNNTAEHLISEPIWKSSQCLCDDDGVHEWKKLGWLRCVSVLHNHLQFRSRGEEVYSVQTSACCSKLPQTGICGI